MNMVQGAVVQGAFDIIRDQVRNGVAPGDDDTITQLNALEFMLLGPHYDPKCKRCVPLGPSSHRDHTVLFTSVVKR